MGISRLGLEPYPMTRCPPARPRVDDDATNARENED